MFTPNDLRNYHTGFEVGDMFGKGRMRELIYNYQLQLSDSQEKIAMLEHMYADQGKAISALVAMKSDPEKSLIEENARLHKDLEWAQSQIAALVEHCGALEAKVEALSNSDKVASAILESIHSRPNKPETWFKEEVN